MAEVKLDTKVNIANVVAIWLAIFGGGVAWATLQSETKSNARSINEMTRKFEQSDDRRSDMNDRLIRIEERLIAVSNKLDKRERLGQ